eukprot:COSAG02_NODE_12663_length_1513_cov_0.950495_1_plen_71_part_10
MSAHNKRRSAPTPTDGPAAKRHSEASVACDEQQAWVTVTVPAPTDSDGWPTIMRVARESGEFVDIIVVVGG